MAGASFSAAPAAQGQALAVPCPLPPGVQPLTDATVEIDHAARTIHVLDCSGVPQWLETCWHLRSLVMGDITMEELQRDGAG